MKLLLRSLTASFFFAFLLSASLIGIAGCKGHHGRAAGSTSASDARQLESLQALAALEPIDAHTHIFQGDPQVLAMLERWHLHVLDILVPDDKDLAWGTVAQQRAEVVSFVQAAHGHASFCTTFDPFRFSQPDFIKSTLGDLDRDFARGAIAVKIWKNIGMELKDSNGNYVLADDPRLKPLYGDITAHNKTLLTHQADPDAAWGSRDPKALGAAYYTRHPEWNMAKFPGAPSKAAVLASRDSLLAKNPMLRVVGAHLGSMEDNLDDVAAHLDRYPNFAVDTAARTRNLMLQPSAKVRAFLIKYQDRVLYGTDIELFRQGDPTAVVAAWQKQLALDWRYLSTSDSFGLRGQTVQGLGLPPSVLHKLYHDNAVHWYPGILDSN